jgi:hypothetical protein
MTVAPLGELLIETSWVESPTIVAQPINEKDITPHRNVRAILAIGFLL